MICIKFIFLTKQNIKFQNKEILVMNYNVAVKNKTEVSNKLARKLANYHIF